MRLEILFFFSVGLFAKCSSNSGVGRGAVGYSIDLGGGLFCSQLAISFNSISRQSVTQYINQLAMFLLHLSL